MDLKQIIEQKRAAAAEERLRKKNLQALEQAAVEDRDRQEKEREELELAREIQNENKPVAPLSFGGIIAKKRKRPESENPPSHELFVNKAAPDPPRSPKKSRLSEPSSDTKSLLSSRQESHTPKNPTKNPYAPERKPRSKMKALYQYQEVVDTRATPSEWYLNTNMNRKYGRSDFQNISYVKTIIKNCIDTVKNDGQPERYISELRTKLHEMEFYEFLSGVLIKKSKVLESEGLLQIFDGPDKGLFPWDLAADAEALWLRWMGGDLDSSLLRGISTTKGILQSGMKRTSHKLEKDYMQKKSANVIGANNLVNGQWWPSRICALRDGAHGEQEAGIHGQTGVGAFSVVVAAGGYADKDHGESIEYCGTPSETSTPTKNTALLQTSYQKRQPLRVLRAVNKKSKYAPKEGIRYDGLYEIVDKEILDPNTAMFRFSLKRIKKQDPIRYKGVEIRPTNQELKQRMKIRELLA